MNDAEGWVIPKRAAKAHYIVDTLSLCGTWEFSGNQLNPDFEGGIEECARCRRELDKRRASAPGEISDDR